MSNKSGSKARLDLKLLIVKLDLYECPKDILLILSFNKSEGTSTFNAQFNFGLLEIGLKAIFCGSNPRKADMKAGIKTC